VFDISTDKAISISIKESCKGKARMVILSANNSAINIIKTTSSNDNKQNPLQREE
jgi:hypothetical protein